MDRDLAKHVIAVSFHSLSLLESLIPVLKTHCSKEDYSKYLKAIGTISAEISTQILSEIFQEYPDVEKEVEDKIKKYGQFI